MSVCVCIMIHPPSLLVTPPVLLQHPPGITPLRAKRRCHLRRLLGGRKRVAPPPDGWILGRKRKEKQTK